MRARFLKIDNVEYVKFAPSNLRPSIAGARWWGPIDQKQVLIDVATLND